MKMKRTIDFVGQRKLFAIVSGLLILASLVIVFTKGLNLGIDFSGGTLIEFKVNEERSIEDIRKDLTDAGLKSFSLQTFGSNDEFLIRMSEKISDTSAEVIIKNIGAELRRSEYVGPQIGKELAEKGILATLFSLIAILAYVSARFQLRFALGAVVALFHDVVLTMGVFAITGREFSLPVLAAVLTIIGYSLNDTIVVYDRIREEMGNKTKEELEDVNIFAEIVNFSINKTLKRTLMTSLTTLVVLASLYIFGGQSINGFAFALLFGVVVGTYSSIFVASPILIYLSFLAPKDKALVGEVEDLSRFNKYSDD
ncbi:MAG: protein translocase subunit SecF [Proteobacteria bacterium]|nr:protein translocase subunit SecF [Pseudomonadota bacterium]